MEERMIKNRYGFIDICMSKDQFIEYMTDIYDGVAELIILDKNNKGLIEDGTFLNTQQDIIIINILNDIVINNYGYRATIYNFGSNTVIINSVTEVCIFSAENVFNVQVRNSGNECDIELYGDYSIVNCTSLVNYIKAIGANSYIKAENNFVTFGFHLPIKYRKIIDTKTELLCDDSYYTVINGKIISDKTFANNKCNKVSK